MGHSRPAEISTIGRTRTLAIDVGGTGLKASVIDDRGRLLTDRVRVDTPVGSPPGRSSRPSPGWWRLSGPSTGCRSVSRAWCATAGCSRRRTSTTRAGRASTWRVRSAGRSASRCGSANDADVQGLAVIAGKGVEMVITLGTGFGTGLYLDGRLAPHLELSHHAFRKGETYDEQLGNAARKRVGNAKWNKRVRKAIRSLRALTSFDHLYIGGGNAKKIDFELDPDVTVVSNDAGIKGGIALWHD